jgi:hypothetical protein
MSIKDIPDSRWCDREKVSEKEAFYRHLNAAAMICKSEGKYLEKFELDGEIASGKRILCLGKGYEDAYEIVVIGEKIAIVDCKKHTYNEQGSIYNGSYWIFNKNDTVIYSQYGELCYSSSGQEKMEYLKTQEGWCSLIQRETIDEFLKDFYTYHKVDVILKKILAGK